MANWIEHAIKHRGVPEGQKIPMGKINAAAKKGGKLGERARLAKTLSTLHHRGAQKLYGAK